MSELNVSGTPTPSAPATPSAAPAPPVAPLQSTPAVAIPSAPVGAPIAPPEDRSTWVPPHRLREIREQAQRQISEREAAYQSQITQYQNQLRALVGASPQPNQEYEPIRQQFGQVFGAKSLSLFDKADQIEAALERINELEAAVNHVWGQHANNSMNSIYSQAAETLGAPLTDEGKRALHAAFTGWVQSNPEYGDRYLNDPGFVNEFWKTLSSTLVDPARRSAAASVASRGQQALPQDIPAGVPSPMQAPKPANLDERASNAWAVYQSSANKNIR